MPPAPNRPPPPHLFPILLVLSFLGGAAALVHQITWVRRLVDVAGATADTFASVTGAFFLGLALGGWLSSKVHKPHPRRLLAGVAWCECAILALASLVLIAPHAALSIQSIPLPDTLLRLMLAGLLIVPPALCMGFTTPWLIGAARLSGWKIALPLYGANTLGAVCGVLLALSLLLPTIGTVGTGLFAISLNALIAVTLFAMGGVHGPRWRRHEPVLGLPWAWSLLAFLSGFLVLAGEVTTQLQLTQITVNSLFASGFVLALVLLGLACGTFATSLLLRRVRSETGIRQTIGGCLLLSLTAAAVQPLLFWITFRSLDYLPYSVGVIPYFARVLGPGLVCVALPFFLMGFLFPALLRAGELKRLPSGYVGRLLAWNGVGGWLGAEAAQGLFLPRLGMWGALPLFCGLVAAVWMLAHLRRNWWMVAGGLATILLAAGVLVVVSAQPHAAPAPDDRILSLRIGREGVVAVVAHREREDDLRILFNNSYTLGGTRAAANQERQAHLPLLLHGNPRTVATLGLATGSTASGALLHPSVERLDAFELSPLVTRYAETHFDSFNRGLFADPRFHPVVADARWAVTQHPGEFDVIVGDLFLPWRTGEGRLFTREHFQEVRRALAPDGLYCQWLPMYQLTERQFDAIARTFLSVFPEAFLVRGDFYAGQPILGLVGGRSLDLIDWEAVARVAEALRSAGATDPLVRHGEGAAMMVVGPLAPVSERAPGPIITLNNGWLEWDGGRNLLVGEKPWFVRVPLGYYLRERHAAGRSLIPPGLGQWHEGGQYFYTLAVAHEGRLSTGTLLPRLLEFLPPSLYHDAGADWQRWPATYKPGPFTPTEGYSPGG